jgi:hypothetical protein
MRKKFSDKPQKSFAAVFPEVEKKREITGKNYPSKDINK